MSAAFRAQSAVEYLLVMIAMLTIASIAAYFLLGASASAQYLVPQSCSFDGGVACEGFVVASNKSSTLVALIGSNSKRYEMRGLSLDVRIGNDVASMSCSPTVIKPGAPFLCFGSFDKPIAFGSQVSATMVINTTYCGMDNCAGDALAESFAGSANAYVSKYVVPKFGVVLSTPVYAPSGAVSLSVNLDVLGHNFTIEQANIADGNVSTSAYSPYAYFVNVSHSSSGNLDTVNVSFAGEAANETFALNLGAVKNMYCSQNQTNLITELLLTGYYSQFIMYPAGLSVFTCPVYNNTVYCADNSSAYYATIPMAELGEWTPTSSMNVSGTVFACLAYDSALYCFTKSGAYYSIISGQGLGSWHSLSYPVFINLTECS
ncbi:MAG: hypothetical protein ACP5T3_03665 [Candidatus Micrarchaeia archaeon]